MVLQRWQARLPVSQDPVLEGRDHALEIGTLADSWAAASMRMLIAGPCGHARGPEGRQVTERRVPRERSELPSFPLRHVSGVQMQRLHPRGQVVVAKAQRALGKLIQGVEEVLELSACHLGYVAEGQLQVRNDQGNQGRDIVRGRIADAMRHGGHMRLQLQLVPAGGLLLLLRRGHRAPEVREGQPLHGRHVLEELRRLRGAGELRLAIGREVAGEGGRPAVLLQRPRERQQQREQGHPRVHPRARARGPKGAGSVRYQRGNGAALA
mmetsp:Transcript_37017/g.114049  ORF Transcript_37017/g.114049 Transcript_37017/m.114049 type:complete len:267 (+) Transcript_37017:412-1212(+)